MCVSLVFPSGTKYMHFFSLENIKILTVLSGLICTSFNGGIYLSIFHTTKTDNLLAEWHIWQLFVSIKIEQICKYMGLEQNLVKPITLENGKIWEVMTIILVGRQSKILHQCEDTTVAVSGGEAPLHLPHWHTQGPSSIWMWKYR